MNRVVNCNQFNMKYLVIFAFCATAAFAKITSDKTLILKYRDECVKENNLNAAELDDETKIPFEDTCFYLCFNKKIGLMKEDGTINEEAILAKGRSLGKNEEEGRYAINLIRKTCNIQANSDPCKTAFCIDTILGP